MKRRIEKSKKEGVAIEEKKLNSKQEEISQSIEKIGGYKYVIIKPPANDLDESFGEPGIFVLDKNENAKDILG